MGQNFHFSDVRAELWAYHTSTWQEQTPAPPLAVRVGSPATHLSLHFKLVGGEKKTSVKHCGDGHSGPLNTGLLLTADKPECGPQLRD